MTAAGPFLFLPITGPGHRTCRRARPAKLNPKKSIMILLRQRASVTGFCLFLLTVILVFSPALPVHGKEGPEPGPVQREKAQAVTPRQAVQEKLATLQKRLAVAEGAQNKQSAERLGVSLEDLAARTAKLREIETLYQRWLTTLTKQESFQKELGILEENLKNGVEETLSQSSSYSLSVYDAYLDHVSAAGRQVSVARQAVSVNEKSLANSKKRLAEAEQQLRALEEKKAGKDGGLAWQLGLAEIERELARALVDFQTINLDNSRLEVKLAELKKTKAEQNIDWIKDHLVFDSADLEKHLNILEQRRQDLERRTSKLRREQLAVENNWLAAQKEVEAVPTANEIRQARSSAHLKAREAWRETYQQVLGQTDTMLQMLSLEEQLWQHRYALLKENTGIVEMKGWRQEARADIENISRILALQQSYQNNVQARIAATQKQTGRNEIDPVVRQHMQTTLLALHKQGERNFEYLTALQGAKELDQRLTDEIDARLDELRIWDQLTGLWMRIESIWKFELFVVDTHGITVGKVVIALIILVLGIILSRFFTGLVHKRLLSHFKMSASTLAITEKLLHYLTIFLVILFAMRIVNIPLTALTFLGGAMAIGVGFGAQKLLNNFISGFILMAEQPIKVGDMVQMEDVVGIIEDIGVRCTKVRTFANIHVLVPNSYFLETNITNWTHNNNMVRGQVTVGVAYGSSTKEVKQLLLKAVAGHDEILEKPDPYVLFNDFGDSALVFDVYFWIMVKRVIDKKRIESDLRFVIDQLFRDAGIVIAFPQRDVNLNTAQPLQMRLVDPGPGNKVAEGV